MGTGGRKSKPIHTIIVYHVLPVSGTGRMTKEQVKKRLQTHVRLCYDIEEYRIGCALGAKGRKKPMVEVTITPATCEDAAEMLEIYAPYVTQTTVSSEYEAPTLQTFCQRIETYTKTLPWLVCRINGRVAGYGYASPHRSRAGYQWSVETSIYVAPDFHRQGVAALRNHYSTSSNKTQDKIYHIPYNTQDNFLKNPYNTQDNRRIVMFRRFKHISLPLISVTQFFREHPL